MRSETNRNKDADWMASALTRRNVGSVSATPVDDHDDEGEDFTPITTYGEVLKCFRVSRRRYPGPPSNLSRQEAVLFRQLQVRATWTPVWAKHVHPELQPSDVCVLCSASRATMAHMLWTCAVTPDPTDVLPPHLARAVGKEDLDSQRGAVQFALEALQSQQ